MSNINEYGMNYYNDRTEKSFNLLYKESYSILYRFLFTKIYSDDDKRLIIDKTMEQVYTKIDKYNSYYKFTTFINMLCMNNINDYYKSFNKLRIVYSDECNLWQDRESYDKLEVHKEYRKLIDMIKEIREPDRTYIIEKYIYGKELKEIAQEHNVSLAKVKNRIYSSLKELKMNNKNND